MAIKRAVFCNAVHRRNYRQSERLTDDAVEQMARCRFCLYCGSWVPTPNAAAIGLTGLPVTFCPNPWDHPEATERAVLVRVGINSNGHFTGRVISTDGLRRWDDGQPLTERLTSAAGHTRCALVDGSGSVTLARARSGA